jgi:large subunit ribosomal protein L13
MSTFMASAEKSAAASRWHIIDAEGAVLGRIATVAARLLQGKHKPIYTPFIDTGDHVVVINARKVKLTGRKEDQKIYRQHSGYEGGLREERARLVRQRKPEKLVEDAVHGMLPKTKMGEAIYRKLIV